MNIETSWKGHSLNCFGECTPDDILTLSTVATMPAVGYGYTYHKSLGNSFWGQMLAFFSFFTLFQVIFISVYGARCGTHSPDVSYYYHEFENGTKLMHRNETSNDVPDNCDTMAVAFFFVLLVISLSGCIYCAFQRGRFRKKHNIKGNLMKDCLTWIFCAPCTLCQEMRTALKLDRDSIEKTKLLSSSTIDAPVSEKMFRLKFFNV